MLIIPSTPPSPQKVEPRPNVKTFTFNWPEKFDMIYMALITDNMLFWRRLKKLSQKIENTRLHIWEITTRTLWIVYWKTLGVLWRSLGYYHQSLNADAIYTPWSTPRPVRFRFEEPSPPIRAVSQKHRETQVHAKNCIGCVKAGKNLKRSMRASKTGKHSPVLEANEDIELNFAGPLTNIWGKKYVLVWNDRFSKFQSVQVP